MYVATLALIIVVAMTPPGLESPTSEGPQSVPFAQWLNDLRAEALEAGISEATVETALGEITPVERVIELDRNQPEVRLDFWTYLDRIASEERIERGRRLLAENRNLLDDIAGRYGIPAPMLVAVWGIESNFGSNLGGFSVINSLATLAYDPRRATMFRRELIQALRILDEGHIGLEDMKGSWAGAMGQVQFMPSTFVDFAEDGNGDGQIDIWQSTPDALESAANFMSRSWRRGYIWGRQVQLPDGFDSSLAGLDTSMPLDAWQALGVRRIDGTPLPSVDIEGSVILPSDGSEPAFLVYQNYRALLRWNRSHFFAIAVGHLADRIDGQGSLSR